MTTYKSRISKVGILIGWIWARVGAAAPLPSIAVSNFDRAPGEGTVTVMAFQPVTGRREAWLGKGLADMVTQRLAALSPQTVLERERMQEFIREIELGETGLTVSERALRLGRVARVDDVVYGSYALEGNKIRLSLFMLSLKTQKVLAQAEREGHLADLDGLVRETLCELLAHRGVDIGQGPLTTSVFHDLSATQSFYRALDHHDRGRPADAYGDFAAAAQMAPDWADAALWRSKMLERLNFPRQALAGYVDVISRFPRSPESLDALALSAALKRFVLHDSSGAERDWATLAALGPVAPQALEAAHQLGRLYESQQEPEKAYRTYRTVVDFVDRVQSAGGKTPVGKETPSRFFSWTHALSLRSDAAVRSVYLYKTLLDRGKTVGPPPPGAILVGNDRPAVLESLPGSTPPLFPVTSLPRWSERFYAVIAPAGQVAEGARLVLKGCLKEAQPYYSFDMRVTPFPFPANYLQSWLGGIFGQTAQSTSLTKTVSFYGNDQGVVGVHLLEANADIAQWGVGLMLRPARRTSPAPVSPAGNGFWEGQIQGTVSLPAEAWTGAARPFEKEYRFPKRELALLRERGGGYLLITVVGQLDGEQTDLWESHSPDGRAWSVPTRLPINSAGDDYDPRLLHAEDGRVALTWLSNRRGRGWDLWWSFFDEKQWTPPRRIPFPDDPRPDDPPTDLMEYALAQTHQGQWIVTASFPGDGDTRWRVSSDGENWREIFPTGLSGRVHGPALAEDGTGRLLLAGADGRGNIFFAQSNDGQSWVTRSAQAPFWTQWFSPEPRPYRAELLSQGGQMRFLFSDSTYGLQFGSVPSLGAAPALDLVARAGLEPSAAAPRPDGSTLIAFKAGSEVTLRLYRSFSVGADAAQDTNGWPIYIDREQDSRGHLWERIHAQARDRVSDVTSLGVAPDGRVWWGMESGVMSRLGNTYFATDVSQGFFSHFVTDIQGCGDTVWFASRDMDRPVVSFALPGGTAFQTLSLPGTGAILSLACGPQGTAYAVTENGDVIGIKNKTAWVRAVLPFGTKPTAMAVDPGNQDVWVGTADRGLIQIEKSRTQTLSSLNGARPSEINGLAFDRTGNLWISIANQGLFQRSKTGTRQFTTAAGLATNDIGPLRADPREGLWYLPSSHTPTTGVGWFDGVRSEWFSPPHQRLDRPNGFDIDREGNVWIGTCYDGVYRLMRKKP